MDRHRVIVQRLLDYYEIAPSYVDKDPFRSLVRTILSQNTNSKSMTYAFNRLESLVGVKPEKIASASLYCIADAIKPAGLYNRRSKILKRVAEEVLNRFNGDLDFVLAKPYKKAKKILMELPGIGPKTADVVLMFAAGVQVIPIDRHIFRIAKRLRIVDEDISYDGVKLALENVTSPGKRKHVHILLIRFGREICKTLKPACTICFLNDICPNCSQN